METVREQWTDERLDDMNARMAESFNRVDEELRALRSEIGTEFAAVRAEMGANHRLQVQLSIGTIGTVLICFLGLLLSHA
jgi:hypothetical protein